MAAKDYRVEAGVDAFDHKLVCEECGRLPGGPHVGAMKARARRHAAANPDHDVWISNVVMTHFFARPRTA